MSCDCDKPIGPSPCMECGGEYGEHMDGCSTRRPRPMINLETWESDKGKQELHHFLAADPQTYVYGVNAQLLGPQACELIRNIVTGRLLELTEGGFRVHGVNKASTHERLTLD